MVSTISSAEEFKNTINSGVVVADFFTDWCHSCKDLEPVINRLAENFQGRATFIKINGDEQPDIATQYGVSGYPTIIIIKKGQQVEKIMGAYPENALKEVIEQHV